MLFNSYVFILGFLPICILGYFGLNYFSKRKWGQIFLLAMSVWFYGYYNVHYLFLIWGSIFYNFGSYSLLVKLKKKELRKVVLLFSIAANIGVLFYFKYYNFFVSNVNSVFGINFPIKEIVLPLGISFFTFQQLSFVIDAYRNEISKCSLLNYASFVLFFPQLIAGPIVMHDELLPQFEEEKRKHFNWENFSKGIYIFALGMAKKVLIADTFGNAVNWGYANISGLNTTSAIIVVLSYTFQIYFDFSGYSDMAIGIGKMLNIDLPMNFNSPYKALTIDEFWNRWHITLTRFLTKYVYIPLGGSRKGKGKTYCNILIVFFISGLWHGAAWTFVIWGLCHGAFMVITRRFRALFAKVPVFINWIISFSFINITWIIFRAETFTDAIELMNQILRLDFGKVSTEITDCFNLIEFLSAMGILNLYSLLDKCPHLFLIIAFIVAGYFAFVSPNANEKMQKFTPGVYKIFSTAVLLVWCIFSFAGMSTFLYFNF